MPDRGLRFLPARKKKVESNPKLRRRCGPGLWATASEAKSDLPLASSSSTQATPPQSTMHLSRFGLLALAAAAVDAFRDTSPFFLASTSE